MKTTEFDARFDAGEDKFYRPIALLLEGRDYLPAAALLQGKIYGALSANGPEISNLVRQIAHCWARAMAAPLPHGQMPDNASYHAAKR